MDSLREKWNLGWVVALLVLGCWACKQVPADQEEEGKWERLAGMWEQEWARTHDPALGIIPRERLFAAKAYTQLLLSQKRSGSVSGMKWTEHGPVNVGGRTRAILFDQNDPLGRQVWAAGVSGGLWHTLNIFDTIPDWAPVDDFFDNIAITTLVQDPFHPDTLYFGTGEGWFNGDAMRGLGIWKTTDGGVNWNALPSTQDSAFFHVQKLIIDAYGNLLAATRKSGVMYSKDGGQSWQQVLGAGVGQGPHDRAADLELSADGSVIATLGILSEGRVYRSDHALHGPLTATAGAWEDISPPGSYQRMEAASAPSDPNRLYVLGQDGSTYEVSGIFSSSDAGKTWTSLPIPNLGKQSWYNLIAAVHPGDPDKVYVGGIFSYRSLNGGQSWQEMTLGHVDHHNIQFSHQDNRIALWSTDGGLYLCQDIEEPIPLFEGRNWGYRVTQFYSGAMHPDADRPEFLGGTQDNGTHFFQQAGMNDTEEVTGGDGGYCHIDQLNPDIQISSFVRNQYRITLDHWASKTPVSFSFQQGWFINPTDYDSDTKTLYCANEEGEYRRWASVTSCMNNSCSDLVGVSAFGTGKVTHILVSPSIPDRLYAGLDNGRVVRVDDARTGLNKTGTWLNATSGMPAGYVSCISVHPANEDHLLASYSNYGLESVWESIDGGQNWTSVEGNLPDIPVRWLLFAPESQHSVLLGTELGVWATDSLSGGATFWQPVSAGLANTRVDMLQWRPSDNNILASTHGRGMFSTEHFERLLVEIAGNDLVLSENAPGSDTLPCGLSGQLISLPVRVSRAPLDSLEVSLSVDGASTAVKNRDYLFRDTTFYFVPQGADTLWLPLIVTDDAVSEAEIELLLTLSVQMPDFPLEVGKDSLFIRFPEDDDPDPVSTDVVFEWASGNDSMPQEYVPFRGDYSDLRVQLLYQKEDLLVAGLRKGFIDALGFEVLEARSSFPYENVSIRLKNSQKTSASGGFDSDMQTVFQGDVSVNKGRMMIPLDSSFFWDATSNLLLEFCYDNSAVSLSDIVAATTSPNISVRYRRGNSGDGCSYFSPGNYSKELPNLHLRVRQGVEVEAVAGEGLVTHHWPGDNNHLYSDSGRIVASVFCPFQGERQCVEAFVHTAGEGTAEPAWLMGQGHTEKSFQVQADSSLDGYTLELYFTADELESWGSDKYSLGVLASTIPVQDLPAGPYTYIPPAEVEVDTFGYYGNIRYRFTLSGNYSWFALSDANPALLPAEGLRLEAAAPGNRVDLSWQWHYPADPEFFSLFRSSNGKQWEPVRKWDTALGQSYSDRPPFSGQWYYRAEMGFSDGNQLISNVASVRFDLSFPGGLRLFPNPANTYFSIIREENLASNLEFQIVNMDGIMVNNGIIPSGVRQKRVFCRNWPAGCYLVVLASGNEVIESKRIIVE